GDVKPGRGRAPRPDLDAQFHDGVQIEVLAVLEAAHLEVALGAKTLELAAHLGKQVGVAAERILEKLARIPAEMNLVEMAPAAPVIADLVVLFVVVESCAVAGTAPSASRAVVNRRVLLLFL